MRQAASTLTAYSDLEQGGKRRDSSSLMLCSFDEFWRHWFPGRFDRSRNVTYRDNQEENGLEATIKIDVCFSQDSTLDPKC